MVARQRERLAGGLSGEKMQAQGLNGEWKTPDGWAWEVEFAQISQQGECSEIPAGCHFLVVLGTGNV